eukprot:gene11987-biopygen22936
MGLASPLTHPAVDDDYCCVAVAIMYREQFKPLDHCACDRGSNDQAANHASFRGQVYTQLLHFWQLRVKTSPVSWHHLMGNKTCNPIPPKKAAAVAALIANVREVRGVHRVGGGDTTAGKGAPSPEWIPTPPPH